MMRRKTLVGVIGSGLLLILGLTAGPLMAADNVPFRAELTETSRLFEEGHGRVMGTYTQTFEGFATHVGSFTASSVTVLTWSGQDLWAEGESTLVAADGDELYMSSWTLTWDGNGEGWYLITGGTGRFEGATGWGDMTVTMGADDVQTAELDGYISR